MTTEAKVKIKATGSREVQRVLKGISKSSQIAEQSMRKAHKRTAREASKEIKDRLRLSKNATLQRIRDDVKAEKASRRELQKTTRAHEAAMRKRERAERRSQQRSRRGGGGYASLPGASGVQAMVSGAGVTAALTGVVSALTSIGARLGVVADARRAAAGGSSRADMVVTAERNQSDLLRVAEQAYGHLPGAEFQERRADLEASIAATSLATGRPQADLIAEADIAQNEYSNLDGYIASMQNLSEAVVATGANGTALTKMLLESRAAFQLAAGSAEEYIGILVEGGKGGGVSPDQFAGAFAPSIGVYQGVTGRGGLAGWREFQALAQVQRQGGGEPGQVATRLRGTLMAFSNPDIQRELAAGPHGINVMEDGEFRRFPDILSDMDSSGRFETLGQIKELFGTDEAAMGIQTYLRVQRDARASGLSDPLRDLINVDAAAGDATVDQGVARQLATPHMQEVLRVRGEEEAERKRLPETDRLYAPIQGYEANVRALFNEDSIIGSTLAGDGWTGDLGRLGASWMSRGAEQLREVGPSAAIGVMSLDSRPAWMDEFATTQMEVVQRIQAFIEGETGSTSAAQMFATDDSVTRLDTSINRLAEVIDEGSRFGGDNGRTGVGGAAYRTDTP